MPIRRTFPSVHVEESPSGVRTIAGVATSITAFIGSTATAPTGDDENDADERFQTPYPISSFREFKDKFGTGDSGTTMSRAVSDFFLNGGSQAVVISTGNTEATPKNIAAGIQALDQVDLINLLCLPGLSDKAVIATAADTCEKRRAFLVLDAPPDWTGADRVRAEMADPAANLGTGSANAAVYFPPLVRNESPSRLACGAVAGVMARTDATRGVWKAPAGREASIRGITGTALDLTEAQNGELNLLGCNCIRTMPAVGTVIWGARTLQGNDSPGSEWKYIPVRRLALFIEESLFRGTGWVVFEPNAEPLWASVRLNIGSFMETLFRNGAFQGSSSRDAYFVKCDSETTTQADINNGIVNILVGFAPLKPAEFVILKIQQIAD